MARHPGRAVALTCLAALAACGTPGVGGGSPGSTPGPPPVVRTADDAGHVCLTDPPPSAGEQGRARLGAAEPAGFVECRQDSERVPGQGEWSVRVERRAVGGVPAFAAALRLPDEPRPASASCAAIGYAIPEVYVLDARGRATRVSWPTDACGYPLAAVRAAYEALRWRTTATRRLEELTPQAAIDSGCPSAYKNVIALSPHRAAGSTPDRLPDGGARVCTYRLADVHDPVVGTFEAGRRLEHGAWADVRRLIETAPRAPADCTAVARRFMVIEEVVVVELDGCRRILIPDGGLRLAGPPLLAALAPS